MPVRFAGSFAGSRLRPAEPVSVLQAPGMDYRPRWVFAITGAAARTGETGAIRFEYSSGGSTPAEKQKNQIADMKRDLAWLRNGLKESGVL